VGRTGSRPPRSPSVSLTGGDASRLTLSELRRPHRSQRPGVPSMQTSQPASRRGVIAKQADSLVARAHLAGEALVGSLCGHTVRAERAGTTKVRFCSVTMGGTASEGGSLLSWTTTRRPSGQCCSSTNPGPMAAYCPSRGAAASGAATPFTRGCCIKTSRKRCCPLAEVGASDAELARVASRRWRVTNDLAIWEPALRTDPAGSPGLCATATNAKAEACGAALGLERRGVRAAHARHARAAHPLRRVRPGLLCLAHAVRVHERAL
jgi:hypothetical protein